MRARAAGTWAAVVLLIATGVILVLMLRSRVDPPVPPPPVARTAAADTPLPPVSPAAPVSAPPASPVAARAGTTQTLCGYGDYVVTGSWTGLPAAIDTAALRTLDAMAQQLATGDAQSRSAALSLQLLTRRFLTPPLPLPADREQVAAFMASQTAAEQAAAPLRADLVRLAQGSRDAAVYRQAYLVCRTLSAPDPHCAQLNAREWARRDPGDGSAWLHVAREARASADDALRDEAYHRLAQATHMSDAGLLPVDRLSSRSELAQAPMATRIGAQMQLVLAASMAPIPPLLDATDYCRAGPALAPAHRQRCDAVAENLLRLQPNAMTMSMAGVIGGSVGWSPARLQALNDEVGALHWAERQLPIDPETWTSCDGFTAARPLLDVFGTQAHAALVLEKRRAAAVPAAELARRHRAEVQQLAERAAAREAAATKH